MITEVIMPKLGQTMEEGTIIEWFKKEGDPIQRGEMLFAVETDKAILEVDASSRGYLRKIVVPEGKSIPVLSVVALITKEADEDISSYGAPETATLAQSSIHSEQDSITSLATVETPGAGSGDPVTPGRIFASPRARKTTREKGVNLELVSGSGPNGRIVEKDILAHIRSKLKATPVAFNAAEALGVDLGTVHGTGPDGRIVKSDVEAAKRKSVISTAPDSVKDIVQMAGLRQIIAERMSASDTQTARVTLVTEADATSFVDVRENRKASVAETWGFTPSYNDLLGLIVARALQEYPYMNARLSVDGTAIERISSINLGMAVDTPRGLLVPVIRDADQLGLRAFGSTFRALVDRAREGKSLPDDLSGGTFTITNLGMYEIDAFTPIINLPEAAILGAGRIHPKVVSVDREIVVRQMWSLSLTFDHRLVDGGPAARFLQRIKHLIENP